MTTLHETPTPVEAPASRTAQPPAGAWAHGGEPTVRVRAGRTSDVPAIVGLLDAHELRPPGIDFTRWSPYVLVAEVQGGVVGVIHMLPSLPVATLKLVVVAPEWVGRGLGSELLAHAEELLRANGIEAWETAVPAPLPWAARALAGWPGMTAVGSGTIFRRRFA